ncbi:MAG: hypothetical protein ACK4TJ_00820 [Tabrizicola sp.]
MLTTQDLIAVADRFRLLTGIEEETTLSHRLFGDTKKLRQLRQGAGITLERFNAAMQWLATRWPDGHDFPDALAAFRNLSDSSQPESERMDAAA